MSDSKKRIPHITGLRGIAILMVILFHLNPHYVPNGFLGVDIFFVISGYLLLRNRNDSQRFDFIGFTEKKVFRIYPALSVLIIFAIISSIPFLYDIVCAIDLGKSGLTSLLGISNFYYMETYSNYFATDANLNPLLHTWYLSVTIQVYLAWAFFCIAIRRFPLCIRTTCIILMGLMSFLYFFSFDFQQCTIDWWGIKWGQKSSISYYDPVGRVWQILAGGLVYIIPHCRKIGVNVTISTIAIFLLCLVGFYNHQLPNWISIPVVICTVLVLKYSGNTLTRYILENKPIIFLGTISFSLYLIHFPIIAFYRRWERTSPTSFTSIFLLLLSVLTAWLLWRLVESRQFKRTGITILIVCAFTTAGIARGVSKLGITWQPPEFPYPVYKLTTEHTSIADSVRNGYNEKLLQGDVGTQQCLGVPISPCFSMLSLSDRIEKPQFVLVGNSNAQHFYAGFHEICKERNIPGIHLTAIIWPMWNYRVWLSSSYCWTKEKANAFIDWLKHQPDLHTVVISHLWKAYARPPKQHLTWDHQEITMTEKWKLQAVKEFCTQLQQIGKHVIILTPSPTFSDFENRSDLGTGGNYTQWRKMRNKPINPQCGDDPFVITKEEYMEFNAEVFQLLNQLEQEGYCKLLHIEKGIFQNGSFCGVQNGSLYCRDKTHITPPASVFIMQGVADDFERMIRQNKNKMLPRR